MKFKKRKDIITRSSKDRRQLIKDRRCIELEYIGPERRIHKDRRHGWEERSDWKRIARWISTPKTT